MKFMKDHAEGIVLAVTVQPRASRNQIVGVHGDALKIKLTAPPVENAANRMCIQFLAKCLGLPRSAVEIVSGHTSRRKHLLIRSISKTSPAEDRTALKAKLISLADGK